MTIPLDHPIIRAFIADAAHAPLADWLGEQGCTASDLAILYAGTAPEHADGISREALALWLAEWAGQREQAAAVRALEEVRWPVYPVGREIEYFVGVEVVAGDGPCRPLVELNHRGKWLALLAINLLPREAAQQSFDSPIVLRPGDSFRIRVVEDVSVAYGMSLRHAGGYGAVHGRTLTQAQARRDLMRRVLALPWVAHVRFERFAVRGPYQDRAARFDIRPSGVSLYEFLQRHGFVPNDGPAAYSVSWDGTGNMHPLVFGDYSNKKAIRFWQVLAPPDLIWPEPLQNAAHMPDLQDWPAPA